MGSEPAYSTGIFTKNPTPPIWARRAECVQSLVRLRAQDLRETLVEAPIEVLLKPLDG